MSEKLKKSFRFRPLRRIAEQKQYLQATERELAKRVERSNVLLELPHLAEALDEQSFLQHVLDKAEQLTHSQIGFMHFVNDDQNTIQLAAWSHNTLSRYCTAAYEQHYPLAEAGIWAQAAYTRQPVMVNDYSSAKNKRGLPPGHSALSRFVSIPVLENGVVKMMTGVGNKPDDYTLYDIETIQLIGNEVWRIVQRNRTQLALQISSQVVNSSPVVGFRWAATENWDVLFVTPNVQNWGFSPEQLMAGQPPYSKLIHPDDFDRVFQEMQFHINAADTAFTQEYRLIKPDGTFIWVFDRTSVVFNDEGSISHFDGVLTDVTERVLQETKLAQALSEQKALNKRLEDANNQLMQSEKMASIGQLAAGIAHELNNPIGFVHSNLGSLDGYVRDFLEIIDAYEQAADKLSPTSAEAGYFDTVKLLRSELDFTFLREDIVALLKESRDGLQRVRKIVLDLKSFSRVGEQEWQPADIHQGLDSTLNIVWNELKYKCEIIKEYGELPLVYCLISQLNQVFMNLLVNAGQAIESRGTIKIKTSTCDNNFVCIEISDTGCGIPEENLHRVFDPFFTTKPVGKGTGLGLSVSYGIIQRHHGRIEISSQVGVGTTFKVFIPVNIPVNPPETSTPEGTL